MFKIVRTSEVTHSEPIGHCIYCGGTGDLTDEHVIPLSLGGNYILDQSSCRSCAAITGKFEGDVARGFMYEARVAADFPTRKPKARPTHLSLQHGRADGVDRIRSEIPARSHPGFMLLPILREAGVLAGHAYSHGLTIEGFETLRFGADPKEILDACASTEIDVIAKYRGSGFARLLAKIAYCSLVASVGPIDRTRVPILPLILGEADDASHWLGSADFRLRVDEERPLHSIGFLTKRNPNDANQQLVVVRVKLFAGSGATGYEVVVAEADRADG